MGEPRQADLEEASDEKNRCSPEDKKIAWSRSCTDMLCCIVFLAFLTALVAVGVVGFSKGDPVKIITPFDSVGNQCGMPDQCNKPKCLPSDTKRDFTEYPYKLLFNMDKIASLGNAKYYAVCVKECPKGVTTSTALVVGGATKCLTNANSGTACPVWGGANRITTNFDTTPVGGNCFPDKKVAAKIFNKLLEHLEKNSTFARYMVEMQLCWEIMAGMAAATILISIIYIFLLKWLTKPLLYISMLLILAGFILLGGFCWMKRGELYNDVENRKAHENNITYLTVGAIVSWVLAFIYACFMCCCWSNISLGASIMEAASAFVTSNLRIIWVPVTAYFVCIPFLAYWVVSCAYLWSIGDVEFKANSFFQNIKWSEQTRYMFYFYIFALLWVISFFICLQQFIVAATVVQWYFSGAGNEDDAMSNVNPEHAASVCRSFKWGIFWNCGSIAFGSFLIALITLIRIIFEYMAKKFEKMSGDNCLYKCVTCYMRYVLWMLDKYIKFMTKNAFIQIALNSCNFCSGAWKSFYLIVRHMGRFSSAAIIGWVMMMLGKGAIMGTSAWLTFLLVDKFKPEVRQPFIPAILICLVAYLVASLFLSVFSFACTAILHCFILDEDTGGDDSITPDSLEPFLKKVNPDRAERLKDAKMKKLPDEAPPAGNKMN